MTYLGLLGSVALLIWLALRGINIVFASLLCSLLIILTNGLPVAEGLTDFYAFGSLGAFTFAGKFFLLFVAGAVFGRIMGDSHAASSIAGSDTVTTRTPRSCRMRNGFFPSPVSRPSPVTP